MNQRIIDIAKSFIGMQEIPNNMGFKDSRFEELMEDTGWTHGQAWCAYFCELVWKIAYQELNPNEIPELEKLFSAGAIKTYNNFKQSKFKVDKTPEIGAIAIWQQWKNYMPQWTGHAGIVIDIINGNQIKTIEGNTNSKGGREGIEVAEKLRKLSFDDKTGLVIKGFIHTLDYVPI